MRPFVLIATRFDDPIADAEYRAFRTFGGLAAEELVRIRLERDPMPELDLDDYSGVFVGGSPFNASDLQSSKSETQVRVEFEMSQLLDRIVAADFPFFGACYGVGTLGVHEGAVIDRTFGEEVDAVEVTLTEAGMRDPLFAGIPSPFHAWVGHKEAVAELPADATLLATGTRCPIQAFRIKNNLYATQFHPELTADDIVERVRAYRFEGYFAPEELDATVHAIRSASPVTVPGRLLSAFTRRYARP
ncbi:glutamine amidotransferase [Planctomonas sp. JC2975]|uniref:glutamine amidotransferase n=1 Tax=Planctomonas sp. JC2975 TaxID=2729626 RepID=UPI0014744D13|nr:glutamine amidotransferase [Planctomonas sp. JC2975]